MADTRTLVQPSAETKQPSSAIGLFFDPSRLNPPSKMPNITLTIQQPIFSGEEGKANYKFVELGTENVLLNQGLNIVKRTGAARAKDSLPEYFAHGAIQEIELGETVGEGVALVLKSLGGLSPEQATKTVAFERDRASLNAWLMVEARPAVVQAINRRISVLEKGASV